MCFDVHWCYMYGIRVCTGHEKVLYPFLGLFCQSMVFVNVVDILDTKNCFLEQKNKFFKNAKESKFSKRVSPQFFFSKNKNYYVDYDQLLTLLHNARVVTCGWPNIPKSENIIIIGKDSRKQEFFSKGQSIVLVKNSQFFKLFIVGKIHQKNVFENILERRNPFQTVKIRS